MSYTPEQQVFIDMIGEAKTLLKDNAINFEVYFGDYPCEILLNLKSQ